jgi:O-antigen ligase
MALALGLFTSITFSALYHIFIAIPCFYYLNKTNYKNWSKSAWFLLALIGTIILSTLLNQDIAVEKYAPLTRVKYYLLALFSIAPVSAYFAQLKSSEERTKKISWLFLALIGTTTLASLSGMGALVFGYNLLKFKAGFVDRNGGLFGMLMNYAQNMSFFMVFLTGLILYRDEAKKYINLNFLYATWAINLLGLYTSYTRGAWLAFFIALPFYFFRQKTKLFLATLVALIIVGGGVYKLAGKSVIRPGSDIERISQWKAAWAGFKERPVLGLGYMNFEKVCPRIKLTYNIEAKKFCGHAHSNYLEMLSTTGVIGFTFFMLWLVSWFVEVYKRNDLNARLALPLIVVFIVGGLTQSTFTLGANLFLIMPLYALTCINEKMRLSPNI